MRTEFSKQCAGFNLACRLLSQRLLKLNSAAAVFSSSSPRRA
jgi:hypothetical protein